ncbi:MAG: PKD domain-containing protein [Candidatus Pacearchaeota archaeon]
MVSFIHFSLKRSVMLVAIVLGLLLIPMTIAEFSVGELNSSLTKTYGPESQIKGWINISFNDETINSQISASFDDDLIDETITLEDILSTNPNYDYSCDPLDCENRYESSNGEMTKIIGMDGIGGEEKLVGFKLEGTILSVDSTEFEIESTAGPSCESQLFVDILNDKNVNILNDKVHPSDSCSLKNYGCFDSSENKRNFNMESSGSIYCQRIELTQSPGFKLGAWIKHISGSSEIHMDLYDLNVNKKGSCSLGSVTSSSGQEYSCDIEYSVFEPEDHYVCIYRSSEGDGKYEIRADTQNSCGFFGSPIKEETTAYQIFAQGKQFDSFGTVFVSDQLPNEDPELLSDKIENYLKNRYGSQGNKIVCPAEGCIVPMKLSSNMTQQIKLKNLNLDYTIEGGETKTNRFYDLSESPVLISSEFGRIFLDNSGIKTPSELGDYEFSLFLGGEEILSDTIEILDVPIFESLDPTSTAAGFPTIFKVKVNIPENVSITNYNWNFGDNESEVTFNDEAIHLYSEIGNYTLEISVEDTRGFSSSSEFEIIVESPKNLINSTLIKMRKNLESVEKDIEEQSAFDKRSLEAVLNLDNQSSKISNLEQRFNSATNDSEYFPLVEEILELKIPENIFLTKTADSFPFIFEEEFIEMGVVEAVGGGDYNSRRKSDYINAVISWNHENIDSTLDFREFSAEYEPGIEPLVNIFEFKITEKKDITYDYYLFVPKLEDITFEGNVNEQGSYFYVNLKDNPSPKFYTTENVDFSSLDSFISPSINNLKVESSLLPSPEDNSRTLIFGLSLVLLMILALVSYIILQQWYKKKYEKHLFPNRNDLYNMVNYVNISKKKGLENREIRKNLKKSDWNPEQINYVMKKYEGKRTGMVEFPLPKFVKNKDESKQNRN